ncbi:Pectinesterase 11 [Dorcoceras hygrometricum]|uniref:pectinesterase n=1 Tax=Dorcoceras hygrometricum TaxID=472368 RepID=A0A2Z7BAN6_9LAMI|nr:Pectinesterase 11 [Dorcoceras hygrometricum]
MGFNSIFLLSFLGFCLVSNGSDHSKEQSTAILIEVDQSGNGDYRKIQDAIDAVNSNNSEHVFILIKPGIYREKILVPEDKPFITLSGTTKAGDKTVITWSESGGIFESPTFSVLGSDFMARYLTIQNEHGSGAKAVALRVSGDRAAFIGCRILSHQDTLLDDRGRHYYSNCYIEGDTDFICGNAASFFQKCHLHSLARGTGAITAQRRQGPAEETGFTFVNSKITGAKSAVLGRPWGAYSRVVFAFTYMSNVILPQGWDDWGNFSNQRTAYYGEYRCYGPGANVSRRVNWSHSLSSQEAKPYLTEEFIDGAAWIRSVPSHFRRITIASGRHVNRTS